MAKMRFSILPILAATTGVIVTNAPLVFSFPLLSSIHTNGRGLDSISAFVTPKTSLNAPSYFPRTRKSTTSIAAKQGGDGKKKRRRRKAPPSPVESPPSTQEVSQSKSVEKETKEAEVSNTVSDQLKLESSFDFSPDAMAASSDQESFAVEDDTQFDLPDIRGALQRKEEKKMEEDLQVEKEQKKRISRKDTDAFIKLMEAQPFADADPENFEEEYDTVSALLGEGAKKFLGIPPGPLQVGHFVLALGIFLMAFIEYPGFPLTNLPSPLRGCLQGGLGTVYLINIVMAIFATFKASERGQSKGLWAMKTFAVGGLAFDQLSQLPTLKELEEVKGRKGKRALKNLMKKK